jgi:chorismate synthase
MGQRVKISIFGQSHSEAVGVVIDGLPAGEAVDIDAVQKFLNRRAPGRSRYSTPRAESDIPSVLSGLRDGMTCGAPLCAVFENRDVRSSDYDPHFDIPRPSHADYPAYVKYKGANDVRGGGHFSGRLTAPLCFAGAVCLQILARKGIWIGAHLASVGTADDLPFDPVSVTVEEFAEIAGKEFPVIDDQAGELMKAEIEKARSVQDSVGGVVECCALGVPAGIGDPMFDGVENRLAAAIFGIPGVKGVEFGAGFAAARMRGSAQNDPYYVEDGTIRTVTNNHGGILGGITTGMPVILRAAFKPTSSIGIEQDSVSLSRMENCKLTVKGRHDPCITVRAVPVVESVMAITLLDFLV